MTLRRLSGMGARSCQPGPRLAASSCSVVGVEPLGSPVVAPPISMTLVDPDGCPGRSTPAPKPKTRLTFRSGAWLKAKPAAGFTK